MSNPVIPNLLSIVTFTAATLAIYAGLALPKLLGRWTASKSTLLLAAGIGVLLAAFFDLLKETAGIGTSTLRSPTDVVDLVAFGIGLLVFLAVHASAGRRAGHVGSVALLYLWALIGIGFHGAGEGIVIGNDFLTGATVLSVFQVSSYLLHKIGEGFTIGLLFVQGGYAWRDGVLSGLLGGLPTFFGVLAGLSGLPGEALTILFAASAGATMFMVIRFATFTRRPTPQMILGAFLGFLYMFLSGVLHQFP